MDSDSVLRRLGSADGILASSVYCFVISAGVDLTIVPGANLTYREERETRNYVPGPTPIVGPP